MPGNDNCYCPECEQKRQDESGHGISAKDVGDILNVPVDNNCCKSPELRGCQCECDSCECDSEKSEKNTQILLEDTKRIANALEQLVKEVKMLRAP